MKDSLRLLPLLSLMAIQPLDAAIVLGTSEQTSPPPSNFQPPQPAGMTFGDRTQHLQPGGMQTTAQPSLTPEQMKALSGSINPEQLQAVAKSFHQQMQAAESVPSESFEPRPPVASAHAIVPEKEESQKSPADQKSELAFDNLLEDVLPLSPDQITRLHKFYDMTLQAKATTPNAPPTPQFSSIRVNLEPGSSPPVIRLAAGFVSSLLFVDSTGAPWPLTAYSIGDPISFNIQWDQKGNAIFIQSLKPYAHGNLAVRLHHLDTPIMITLVSGQRNVDFRVDLQVPGRGPDAKAPVVDTTFNAKVNPILMNILDGIPPINSIKLEVVGGQGDAWLNDDKIYFRTKLTVLSPAWLGTVSSPDGTHVYEMMITPYIMASHEGKTVNIKLAGL